MKINVGENIKRFRKSREITQEQLADALNISCAAVSKWERGETLPDITLLFPLAQFFNVTLDELMSYDAAKIEREICDGLEEYSRLCQTDFVKSRDFIIEMHQNYPNDYRIMIKYMFNLGGDYADNDPQVLLKYKDEFFEICKKIDEGCKDVFIRLDALNMKAKLLWAEGRVGEATEIYKNNFPDWYMTVGQKTEQLFSKSSKEFSKQLRLNMIELADFSANKKLKEIWFCKDLLTCDQKEAEYMRFFNALDEFRISTGYYEIAVIQCNVISDFTNKVKHFYGKPDNKLKKHYQKRLELAKLADNAAKNDSVLHNYIKSRLHTTCLYEHFKI